MLFSVLIANYNGGKYLSECIDSVLKQTYSNWEIVIVDDASTDDSLLLYQNYQNDDRIHIYLRGENKGCTFTKAECIQYARGEICAFLDSDDYLEKNAIEEMVKAHYNKKVSLVSSRYKNVDENGVYLSSNRLLKTPIGGGYLLGRDYSPEHFVSFKRDAYFSTKGLDILHKFGDDQELYLLLEEVGEWVVLDQELYNYRIYKNSISRTKTFECYFWNIIVRYEACIRRGVNPTDYAYKDFIDALDEYAMLAVFNKEKEIRNSVTYKIGNIVKKILLPFK